MYYSELLKNVEEKYQQLKDKQFMTSFEELRMAMFNNEPLIWNDPDPIKGVDYTITYIEDTSQFEIEDYDMPILILYGDGSEAQVYLHEIKRKI